MAKTKGRAVDTAPVVIHIHIQNPVCANSAVGTNCTTSAVAGSRDTAIDVGGGGGVGNEALGNLLSCIERLALKEVADAGC